MNGGTGGFGEQEFEALACELRLRLEPHIARMLRSWDLVEDVINETLLRLWRWRERLDPERNPAAYAYVIACRLALKILREMRRVRVLADRGAKDGAEDALAARELLDLGLADLNEHERDLFDLIFVDELSIEEIAGLRGIEPHSVRSQKSRLLRHMRDLLGDEIESA
jgi:RNA polymerase sigma factor (sigma-70 family)